MFTIYALVDPRDNAIRYVGMTNNVYARFYQHLNGASNNAQKDAWIVELKQAQAMLIMKTLEVAETYDEAKEREVYWIRHYQISGAMLFNQVHMIPAFKKRSAGFHVGRQSNYSKVRDIVLQYHITGQWPASLSDDMKKWYQLYYFTKPNKKRDGAKYRMHTRSYERGRQWITEMEGASDTHPLEPVAPSVAGRDYPDLSDEGEVSR